VLKKQIVYITVFYSLALAVVCLIPSDTLPDVEVSFADKIFHSVTYVVLTFLWFYSLVLSFKMETLNAIVYASVISIIFGIIIEVLQETLTETRRGDVLDVLANSLGVLFAASIIWFKNRNSVKKL
jgi:VanZ family protein